MKKQSQEDPKQTFTPVQLSFIYAIVPNDFFKAILKLEFPRNIVSGLESSKVITCACNDWLNKKKRIRLQCRYFILKV
jgi:hypothetical protein